MGLKYNSRIQALFVPAFIAAGLLYSCTKDKVEGITDAELLELAKKTDGSTFYAFSPLLLDKSAGSGHPQPFLRTRYNAIAASQLDMNGKIRDGAAFPEGSLIVKELYSDPNTIDQYAILYKKATGVADSRGWVWGYVKANGTVVVPASKKGSSCINCHSQNENRDYMLMNKYFP